jgi:hypothetical protein
MKIESVYNSVQCVSVPFVTSGRRYKLQKDGITGEFRRNAPECGGFADALSESLKQNRLSELKIPVKRFA